MLWDENAALWILMMREKGGNFEYEVLWSPWFNKKSYWNWIWRIEKWVFVGVLELCNFARKFDTRIFWTTGVTASRIGCCRLQLERRRLETVMLAKSTPDSGDRFCSASAAFLPPYFVVRHSTLLCSALLHSYWDCEHWKPTKITNSCSLIRYSHLIN